MWFSEDICDFNETEFSLFRPPPPPKRGTVCLSSRHHFSYQSRDRCRVEPIYSLEILTWICPEMTRGEVAYFSVIRKGVGASSAKWISSCVANMGHFCAKFSGLNFYPPRFPALGSHYRQPHVLWSKFLTSTVIWKACRRNWTLGKSCLVGFLHHPPWKRMWGKCLMSVSLKQLWGLLQTHSERREISSGVGPLTSSFRDGTLSLYQQTPRGSYWRADAPRREHSALSGSLVTRRGLLQEPRAPPGPREPGSSRELLMGLVLPGRYQWTVEENSDRQRLLRCTAGLGSARFHSSQTTEPIHQNMKWMVLLFTV